jgi:hypothetical protein
MMKTDGTCEFWISAYDIRFMIPYSEMLTAGSFDRAAILGRLQAEVDRAANGSGNASGPLEMDG